MVPICFSPKLCFCFFVISGCESFGDMEVSVIGSSQVKTELAYRELGFCNLKGGKAVISSKNRVCVGRSTGWRKSGIRFTLRATAAIQSEQLRSDSVSGRSTRSKSVSFFFFLLNSYTFGCWEKKLLKFSFMAEFFFLLFIYIYIYIYLLLY